MVGGLAILMVLFDHLQAGIRAKPLPFGRTGTHGVALFFVLSGFLITSRLLAEMERSGTISLRRFYIRRFFRLMPAAWVYLTVIGLLAGGRYIVSCLLFFRNFVDPHETALMNAHFWSLSIEEQFYLVWPATLLVARPRRALWIAATAAVIVVLSRTLHASQLTSLPFAATVQTYFRADAILIGCCAAILLPRLRSLLPGWTVWPLLCIFLITLHSASNIISCGESIVIALLLVVTSTNGHIVVSRILRSRPLAFVGSISYSLYLWQEVTLRFPGYSNPASVPMRLIALAALALASYYFIERPLNHVGHKIARGYSLPSTEPAYSS